MTLGVDEKINGVNLGNWLVLEKWMKPALFEECGEDDEIWMHRTMEPSRLEALLRRHRETYVTERDFIAIASHGYNLVCIPVPYFVFGDVEGYPGCIEYVDRAFAWADRCGLQVLLDLHTVPGSQNGYDNGGITGVCTWRKDPEAVEYALTVLERLAKRYRNEPALYGMEVLNEPISWLVYRTAPSTGHAKDKEEAKGSGHVPMRFLKDLYRDAYRRLRAILKPESVIVFHDGFRLGAWRGWFGKEGMTNVMLDTHIYIIAMETFVPVPAMWLYRLFVAYGKAMIRLAARHVPVMVGEWCLMNTLAQRQRDAVERKAIYREVARLELDAWNVSAGQIYWSYRLLGNDAMGDSRGGNGLEGWDLTCVWRNGWMAQSTDEGADGERTVDS